VFNLTVVYVLLYLAFLQKTLLKLKTLFLCYISENHENRTSYSILEWAKKGVS